jgi:Putative peptidoglycan binding domain/LysM domain
MSDIEYSVSQGDCLTSIADQHGFYWKTLWDRNSALKALRKNPNVLFEGDKVRIPEKELKESDCATEKRHRFVKRGTPAKLRIVVERFGQPIKNKHYILTIDGSVCEGTTSSTGLLDEWISPQARQGTLVIPDENLQCDLDLGHLDPIDEIVGVQRRLQNLGLYAGPLDGELNEETREAVAQFQAEAQMTATGELDAATREKLIARHDQEHAAPPLEEDSNAAEAPADNNADVPGDVEIDPVEDDREMERFENMDEE